MTRIKIRDNYTCRYCEKDRIQIHIDHVKPLFQGGSDWSSNLVTSCKKCNLKKGSKKWYPKKIPFWRYIYSVILMFYLRDYPKWKDFF